MQLSDFAVRLVLAFGLGALVGLERQWRQRSAGLRTNTLVSVGAASFLMLSESLTAQIGDPSRIAGQIVTGIGFLGAGVILRNGTNVQGLNTAATIWCSAAVGTLAGAGLWLQATLVTAAVLSANLLLRSMGLWLNRLSFRSTQSHESLIYNLQISCKEEVENHIRALLVQFLKQQPDLRLRALASSDTSRAQHVLIQAQIESLGQQHSLLEEVTSRFTFEYGVSRVHWEVEADPPG